MKRRRLRFELACDQTPGTSPAQEKGRNMSEQPSSGGAAHQPAVEILAKIVAAADRLKRAREHRAQASDLEEARQGRRTAVQEARELLQREAPNDDATTGKGWGSGIHS